MPEEVQFLGLVRFAKGPGCECLGERRVTYRKMHHSWGNFPTGIVPREPEAWLHLDVGGDFFGPTLNPVTGQLDGDSRGSWDIARRTGQAPAPEWALRGPEYAVESTDRFCRFLNAGKAGITQVSGQYGFAALDEDLQVLLDAMELSIWSAPSGKESFAGFRECSLADDFIYRAGRIEEIQFWQHTPWNGVSWLGGGAPDGGLAIEPAGVAAIFRDGGAALISRYAPARWIQRQRAVAMFKGYFSAQEVLVLDSGSSVVEERGEKTYWRVSGGAMDAWSPRITAAEAARTTHTLTKTLVLLQNDLAPDGVLTRDWPRLAGAGGAC